MSKKKRRRPGFRVPCPLCGSTEGLSVQVLDLTMFCFHCRDTVPREAVDRLIDDARGLLRWLDDAGVTASGSPRRS